VAFIDRVEYCKDRSKVNYRKKVMERYLPFFRKIQNPMTRLAPFRTARLLADPDVAIYFREGMKPFFPSQKFIQERDDGSVEFTVEYTQPLEILPFVKQWLPSVKILAPVDLQEIMRRDIGRYVESTDKPSI